MTNQELLFAISDLLDKKLEEKLEQKLEQKLDQKFDEKLKPIYARLDCMDERFDRIEERLDRVEERLDRVEERLDRVEERLDHMDEELGSLKLTMNRNYSVVLDFYGRQREFNTQIMEFLHLNHGNLINYAQFSS